MKDLIGTYKHYKGNKYKVIAIANHSETLEHMVVYCDCSADPVYWVRPLEMFLENVIVDGNSVKRFEKIENTNENTVIYTERFELV